MRTVIAASLLLAGGAALSQQPAQRTTLHRVWADSLTDVSGTVSRDGRYLTYIDWETYDIHLRDLESGQTRPVTSNRLGGAAEPLSMAFSPDGKAIAYTVTPPDSISAIQTLSLRGGEPRTVYRGPGYTIVCDWTPDGKALVVARSMDARETELGIVGIDDGSFRRLATGRGIAHAQVSPNGKLVVFEEWSQKDPTVRNLAIVSLSGGEAHPLIVGSDDWSPVWTPQGDGVLFVSARGGGRGLWHVEVSGGNARQPRRLTALAADMTILGVSVSGRVFLGAEGQGLTTSVAEMHWPEGSADHVTPIATPEFRDARRAVFSPDSKRIAYMLKPRSYGTRPGWLTPTVATVRGGSARSFPTRLTLRDAPQWFPDGQSLLFIVDQAGSGEGAGPPWTFWRLDLKTGGYHQVGAAASAGLVRVVGLNEREFVYKRNDYSQRPAVSAIEAVDLRTGVTRQIFQTTGSNIANAALSNRGDRIAIAAADTMGRVTLSVLTPGSEPHIIAQLRRTNARAQLMWFQNDEAILISGTIGAETGLWRVPINGSPPKKLAVDGQQMTEARLSPDGKYLAYTVRGTEPSEIISFDLHEGGLVAKPSPRQPYNDR